MPEPWRYVLWAIAIADQSTHPHAYLWAVAAWAVGCAALAVGAGRLMQDRGFRDPAEAATPP